MAVVNAVKNSLVFDVLISILLDGAGSGAGAGGGVLTAALPPPQPVTKSMSESEISLVYMATSSLNNVDKYS
jgi:hypothetical protein